MHVLILPAWYPSPEDPIAGVFTRDQALAMTRHHDVTVLAPPSSAAPADMIDGAVRVLRLPPSRGTGRRATLARLQAMSAMVARLQREGRAPDVVHAHVYSAGALAVLLGRRWRMPVVLSEHDSDLIEGLVRGWDAWVARFAFRYADVVCPVSEVLRRSIVALEPRARCEVVGNVVDIEAFAAPPQRRKLPSEWQLLAVARLVPAKGLSYLLDAVRLLVSEYPGVALKIVGDGPDRAVLEAQAHGLPVVFLGSLPRADIAAYMREADALVVPSLVEPFGIVAVEALAAALPVVITNVSGAADVVATHGGRTVRPADPCALRDAITEVFDRQNAGVPPDTVDDLRRQFGESAIAASFDAIYRSLLPRA
jgi:L-malate glycosyltransferase